MHQAVERDVLYDIHKGASAKEVAKFVFPEPVGKTSVDRISTKRVVNIAPIGDNSVPDEMVQVLGLIAPEDDQDPPMRYTS